MHSKQRFENCFCGIFTTVPDVLRAIYSSLPTYRVTEYISRHSPSTLLLALLIDFPAPADTSQRPLTSCTYIALILLRTFADVSQHTLDAFRPSRYADLPAVCDHLNIV